MTSELISYNNQSFHIYNQISRYIIIIYIFSLTLNFSLWFETKLWFWYFFYFFFVWLKMKNQWIWLKIFECCWCVIVSITSNSIILVCVLFSHLLMRLTLKLFIFLVSSCFFKPKFKSIRIEKMRIIKIQTSMMREFL